jgi:hypothetical protein
MNIGESGALPRRRSEQGSSINALDSRRASVRDVAMRPLLEIERPLPVAERLTTCVV